MTAGNSNALLSKIGSTSKNIIFYIFWFTTMLALTGLSLYLVGLVGKIAWRLILAGWNEI